MKRALFVVLIIFFGASFSYGKFEILGLKDRVKEADLIVIGTLSNITKSETKTTRCSEGTLKVEQIVFGTFKTESGKKLSPEEDISVGWTNSKLVACQYGPPERDREIWFLKIRKSGTVYEIGPGSAESLDELPKVRRYLKKKARPRHIRSINLVSDYRCETGLSPFEENRETEVAAFDFYNDEDSSPTISTHELPTDSYSPFAALLTFGISFLLYLLLYKSRFRTR